MVQEKEKIIRIVLILALAVVAAFLAFSYKNSQPRTFPSAEEIQAAKKQLAEQPAPKGVDPVAWSAGEIEFKTPDTFNRVIVRFKEGTSEAAQNEIISRYEGQLLSSFEFSPYSKSILVPEQNREGLSSDPSVTDVQSDEPIKMTQDTTQGQTVPWSVSKIGADAAWGKGIKGAGIKVAVIDTGIDIDNPDLRPAIDTTCSVSYFNRYFDNSGNDPMIFAQIDTKENGHGSHVAGVIAARDDGHGVVGVAPEAKLCVIRVLDKTGSGSIDATVWGIRQAIKSGVQVINMSIGVIDGSQELKDAVQAAVNAGIVVVAAAGNAEHLGNIIYPAKYSLDIPGVIAVTAVDNTNYKNPAYKFPNGPEITFAAPGVNIRSDCPPEWKKPDGSTVCADVNVAERTGVTSGSSMAAPSVTGQVALLLSQTIKPAYDENKDGRWQPSEVLAVLKASAINPASGSGKDNEYGYGVIPSTGLMLRVGTNITFSCTNAPANSTVCPNSDTSILQDTPSSLVSQCSVPVVDCQYTCQTGFHLDNGACVASAPEGSLTPSATVCPIPGGESRCRITLTWTSRNAVNPGLFGTNMETGASYTVSNLANNADPLDAYAVGPDTVFQLKDGDTVLSEAGVTGRCDTGTRWNGNVCAPPPTVSNVTINDPSVIPDASTQYTITASASNSGGGNGIKSASVIINWEGANKGAYRGLLAWSNGNLGPDYPQKISCGADASAGSAGIFNGNWNNGAGKEYVNLVSCSTAVSGDTRTTSFVVTFNPNFTSPTSNNTLSGSVVSDSGTSVWKPFDTFSISEPPPDLTVPTGTTVIPATATVGQSTPFSGVVKNIGTGPATKSPGFPNVFRTVKEDPSSATQITMSNGQVMKVNLASLDRKEATPLISSLAPGAASDPVGISYTFVAAGTYAVSLCANINVDWNRNDSVEDPVANNDCGDWMPVTVSAPAPAGTWTPATLSCPTACGTGASTQTQTCTGGVCSGTAQTLSCDATPACTCEAPLTQNVTVACDAREGYTVSGLVTRSQTKSAYPGCAFPSAPVTADNSTYVSDTCAYTLIPTGTWTAPTCPSACGTGASNPAYTCVGGNGQCAVNTPATLSCAATAPCACDAPLTQTVTVPCDPNSSGAAAVSGSVMRSQTKTAYPSCTFGTPVTSSNSTYVSDTCVYPATTPAPVAANPIVADTTPTGTCTNGATDYPACSRNILCTNGIYTPTSNPAIWQCAGVNNGKTVSCSVCPGGSARRADGSCPPGTPTGGTPTGGNPSGGTPGGGTGGTGGGPSITLWRVAPLMVRPGERTNISWEASGVASCTISSTNDDLLTGAAGDKRPSKQIYAQTIFSIKCGGISLPSKTVNILPVYEEQ